MNENDIKQKIFECLNNTGISISTFETKTPIADIVPDSLTFITLIIELESAFGIEIPAELMNGEAFETIEDIHKYIINTVNV